MNDLLTVHGLCKNFLLHRQHDAKLLTGCSDVSFSLKPGEFMGIAGTERGRQVNDHQVYLPHLSA